MTKAPPPRRDSPGRLLDLELAALGALLGRPEPPAPPPPTTNATPPGDPPASGDAASHPPAIAPLRGNPP